MRHYFTKEYEFWKVEDGPGVIPGQMAKNGLVHPGKVLKNLLTERGLSVTDLASQISVPVYRLTELIAGGRNVLKLAFLLGPALDTTPEYWLNIQKDFDEGRPVKTACRTRTARRELKDPVVREEALALVDSGLSSEEAGEAVGAEKMTVAGWRSARTKGCYT